MAVDLTTAEEVRAQRWRDQQQRRAVYRQAMAVRLQGDPQARADLADAWEAVANRCEPPEFHGPPS